MTGKTAAAYLAFMDEKRLAPTRRRCLALAEAQNWRCAYCAVLMTPDYGMARAVTLDHVIPLSDGGKRHPDNEVAACAFCNNGRGSINAEVYYYMVQKLGPFGASARARLIHAKKMAIQRQAAGWPSIMPQRAALSQEEVDARTRAAWPAAKEFNKAPKPPMVNEVQARMLAERKIMFQEGDVLANSMEWLAARYPEHCQWWQGRSPRRKRGAPAAGLGTRSD